jgi:hypothetical protein
VFDGAVCPYRKRRGCVFAKKSCSQLTGALRLIRPSSGTFQGHTMKIEIPTWFSIPSKYDGHAFLAGFFRKHRARSSGGSAWRV